MRTFAVIKDEILGQTDRQFDHRGITLEIHVFIFDITPESLNENIVKYSAPAIHTDCNAFAFQHAYEGVACEL